MLTGHIERLIKDMVHENRSYNTTNANTRRSAAFQQKEITRWVATNMNPTPKIAPRPYLSLFGICSCRNRNIGSIAAKKSVTTLIHALLNGTEPSYRQENFSVYGSGYENCSQYELIGRHWRIIRRTKVTPYRVWAAMAALMIYRKAGLETPAITRLYKSTAESLLKVVEITKLGKNQIHILFQAWVGNIESKY